MRGDFPISIQIISGGLISNLPPHLAPPNSITAGSNVYRDIDGYIKPRSGYQPFLPTSTSVPGNLRLHGGIGYQDQNSNYQYVVASNAKWFADVSGTWTDISDPANQNIGASTDPARFHTWYQGGLAYIIGVDNFSTPKWWTSSFSVYQPLNTASIALTNIVGNGTTAIATPTTPVTNIVIGDSITITGNSNGGFNVTTTVTATTPTTFSFLNATNATGIGGTVTDNTTQIAPSARDIEVIANRVVLVNTTENGTRFPRRIRWSASGDATRWPQLAFLDALDHSDQIVAIRAYGSNLAIVYGQYSFTILEALAGNDASAFGESPVPTTEGFVGPAGSAAVIYGEGIQYYVGADARMYSFNGTSITPVSQNADPTFLSAIDIANGSRIHGSYLPNKRQIWFFCPTATLSATGKGGPIINPDPSIAEVYDIPSQSILPPQVFSEGITTSFLTTDVIGITWLNAPGTWTTIPYTWEDAPTGFEQDIFIGTASGEVDLFFHGNIDGSGKFGIPYGFTLALYQASTPSKNVKLSRAEVYLIPTMTSELITVQFNQLGYPNDPGTPLVSLAVAVSAGWTTMPIEPGPTNPANTNCNFLQLQIFSARSFGNFAFAGGTIYLWQDDKSDYGIV